MRSIVVARARSSRGVRLFFVGLERVAGLRGGCPYALLGPGKITKSGVSEVHDYARQHQDNTAMNNSDSLQDDPKSGHRCLSSPLAIRSSCGRILLMHAVFISAPAKITAKRGTLRGNDEVEYL